METDIHERLAVVETKLNMVMVSTTAMAANLLVVSNHIMAETAAKAAHGRALTIFGSCLVGAAGLWTAFGDYIRKLFA